MFPSSSRRVPAYWRLGGAVPERIVIALPAIGSQSTRARRPEGLGCGRIHSCGFSPVASAASKYVYQVEWLQKYPRWIPSFPWFSGASRVKTYGKLHKYFQQMSAQEAVIKLLLERVYQVSLIGQLHFPVLRGMCFFAICFCSFSQSWEEKQVTWFLEHGEIRTVASHV